MISFIFGFIGIYKIFVEQQNKSIQFSFESCPQHKVIGILHMFIRVFL